MLRKKITLDVCFRNIIVVVGRRMDNAGEDVQPKDLLRNKTRQEMVRVVCRENGGEEVVWERFRC